MKQATEKQKAVLRAIYAHHCQYGYSPSADSLCTLLGYTKQNLWAHLTLIQAKGLLTWVPHCTRTFLLTDKGKAAIGVSPVRYAILRENPRRWQWLKSAQFCAKSETP